MTASLQHLIAEARAAADPKQAWVDEGGRACPHGQSESFLHGCSQPVFRLAGTEHYDDGQRGGPGWRWCRDNCMHGYRDHFQ